MTNAVLSLSLEIDPSRKKFQVSACSPFASLRGYRHTDRRERLDAREEKAADSPRRGLTSVSRAMKAFLDALGLSKYQEVFEEEELDEKLLRSMSEKLLVEALTELGIDGRDQLLLRAALGHPVAPVKVHSAPRPAAQNQAPTVARESHPLPVGAYGPPVAPKATATIAGAAPFAGPARPPQSSAAAIRGLQQDGPEEEEEVAVVVEEEDPNSPAARARRRREAAEAGRKAALEDAARAAAEEAAERAEAEKVAARRQESELEERRKRAARMADQLEARVRAAPPVVPEPPKQDGPRPRVPNPAIVAAAAAASGSGGAKPTDEEQRAKRVSQLRRQRDEQKAERERLLAEAKADRAHRQARFGQAVGLNAEEAGAAKPGAAAAAATASAAPTAPAPTATAATTSTSAPSPPDAAAIRAKVAAMHAKLVSYGTPPAEAAALALKRVMNGEDADGEGTPAGDAPGAVELEGGGGAGAADLAATPPAPPAAAPAAAAPAALPQRVKLVKLMQSTKPAERAAERASRLSVRLAHGDIIELPYSAATTVEELLLYLAEKQGASMKVGSVEELVEGYALLNRAAFPPVELDADEGTLGEAGILAGTTLVLQRRGAQIQKGERRKIGKLKPKKTVDPNAPPKVPSTRLELPGGRVTGKLTGSYTFQDEAFRRAGMAVLVVEPTPEGDAVLASLQGELHFLAFGFRLPSTSPSGTPPTLSSWRDDVYEVLQWLLMQTPMLCIRALIGHGAAADACHAYATMYGEAASSPVRMLVQLNGSHAARSPGPIGSNPFAWPTKWKMLSIVGDADPKTSVTAAQAFHDRYRDRGHKLRVLGGADRALQGHITAAAASINDWIEGARRLTADDVAAWDAKSGTPRHYSGGAKGAPAVDLDAGPPLGSMERVRDVQVDCMCEDLPVDEKMTKWTEARLRDYFDKGGGTVA